MTGIAIGFELEPVNVALEQILPSRKIPAAMTNSTKFRQIRTSIEEIGLIEPLSITPALPDSGHHLLLDGHIRLLAMREIGYVEAPCLVANDDESYTYNNRINRLSTIQEHVMLRRAVERGVSPERLAKVIGVDVSSIMKKMSLLDGICAEAAKLLEDRQFSAEIVRVLRKMKASRQVECVGLMVSASKFTVAYAEALLVATPAELLVEGTKPRKMNGVTQEQMEKMEREMANVQSQYKVVEQTYSEDVLNLVIARGYLANLLANKSVVRYLKQRQPEVLARFESIVQAVSLDE